MSFKGIRSRLRNEPLDGSPSRMSFFHQLSSALHSDDNQRLQQEVSNGHLLEEELLTLVTDDNENDPVADGGGDGQRRLLLDVPPDRTDSPSPTDGDPLPGMLRQPSRNALSSGEDRPTRRHRFSARSDKKRADRSKSRERPSTAAPAPAVAPAAAAPVTAASGSSLPPSVANPPQEAASNNQTNGGDTATEEMNGSGSRQNRIKTWARKLVNDLQVIDESNGKDEESSSSHSLSMKRLKTNMIRFGQVTQPISSFASNVQSLRQWESPTATLLLIMVLVYVLQHDLCVTFLVSLSLYKLSMNYLTTQ